MVMGKGLLSWFDDGGAMGSWAVCRFSGTEVLWDGGAVAGEYAGVEMVWTVNVVVVGAA